MAQLYYQIEQENAVDSLKQKSFSDLFDEIVEEPFYNQLRYGSLGTVNELCCFKYFGTYYFLFLFSFILIIYRG